MRLHHTGIISQDIEKDVNVYLALGYRKSGEPIIDLVQNNRLAFFKSDSGDIIELIEPLNGSSSVKNAESGIHHICYETDNFDMELENIRRLRLGTVFTGILRAPAFDGRRIVFIYLRTKLIIELLESKYTHERKHLPKNVQSFRS